MVAVPCGSGASGVAYWGATGVGGGDATTSSLGSFVGAVLSGVVGRVSGAGGVAAVSSVTDSDGCSNEAFSNKVLVGTVNVCNPCCAGGGGGETVPWGVP